eukprot:2301383-Pyramimonas_sp.AAC.1
MSASSPDTQAARALGESTANASSITQDITAMNVSGLRLHPCKMPERCGRPFDVNPKYSTSNCLLPIMCRSSLLRLPVEPSLCTAESTLS